MKKFKKAISMATAAALAVSMMSTAPAFAEEADTSVEFVGTDGNTYTLTETAKLGDYDCWVMDGMYFTEIDGEICQVIDLSQLNWVDADEPISRETEVDLSDGSEYAGQINITDGDYTTPIFIGCTKDTDADKISYCIHADVFKSNLYMVDIYGYDVYDQRWKYTGGDEQQRFNFSFVTPTKILFNGMSSAAYSKVKITFLKEGSTGKSILDYTMYVKEK